MGRRRSGVTLPDECWDWLAEASQRDGSTRDDLLEGLVYLGMDADHYKGRRDSTTNDAITCPRCNRTSYHPQDIKHGYCGRCHWWTSDPAGVLNRPDVLAQAEAQGVLKGVRP